MEKKLHNFPALAQWFKHTHVFKNSVTSHNNLRLKTTRSTTFGEIIIF